MAKILKCSSNDDVITLKAEDSADSLTFMFESPSQDRISDFELKLMSIDSEHLGIPDTDYTATIKMPASEFQRITRDLQIVGDTVKISVTKDGVKFSVSGDLGSGNTMIRQTSNVDKPEDAVTIDLEVRDSTPPRAPLPHTPRPSRSRMSLLLLRLVGCCPRACACRVSRLMRGFRAFSRWFSLPLDGLVSLTVRPLLFCVSCRRLCRRASRWVTCRSSARRRHWPQL